VTQMSTLFKIAEARAMALKVRPSARSTITPIVVLGFTSWRLPLQRSWRGGRPVTGILMEVPGMSAGQHDCGR